jgi:ethanolamine utilization microcompartment shell protein EutL
LVLGLIFIALPARADWTTAQRLTWTSSYSYNPAIAMDSTYFLHVVWADYSPGTGEIYYKRSTTGGMSWSPAERLTWTSSTSDHPSVAVDSSNNVHVVWEDYASGNWEIYHKKSTNGGATWTASQRLTWSPGNTLLPVLTADSTGNLHLAWQQNETPGEIEVYYKQSTDAGATWSTSQRLTWTSGWSTSPALAVSASGVLHLVWNDSTSGNVEVYYKKSTDGGAAWTASQRITWMMGLTASPAIAVSPSGQVNVVWEDTLREGEIYYKKSTTGGVSWTTTKRLTWTSGLSQQPFLATDLAGTLYVVWGDNSPGNLELYGKKSTDAGTTWTTSQRLTWTSAESLTPGFVADSLGDFNIVWSDNLPGNFEIYFKKGK